MSSKGNEEAVALLEGLIRHYSPSREERSAVQFLVERMKALGFTDAHVDEVGNAVATKERRLVPPFSS